MEPSKQIRAVAQTYLQEQQLKEQAEYIAVLENTIAVIANEIGVDPQELIKVQLDEIITSAEARLPENQPGSRRALATHQAERLDRIIRAHNRSVSERFPVADDIRRAVRLGQLVRRLGGDYSVSDVGALAGQVQTPEEAKANARARAARANSPLSSDRPHPFDQKASGIVARGMRFFRPDVDPGTQQRAVDASQRKRDRRLAQQRRQAPENKFGF